MKTVPVRLGERSYEIQIGKGMLAQTGAVARKMSLGKKGAVITDSTVGKLYASTIVGSLKEAGVEAALIQVPPGEKSKSLEMAQRIWDEMLGHGMDRSSFIVALGGGVAGDLAGFAASVFMRAVPYIQVPTTLLAQVDSSVGGKVGVNLPQGKNLIGSFYQPRAVLIDTAALKTLPPREFKSGLAEVIKYGIIWDKAFFDFLDEKMEAILALEEEPLVEAIAKSCQIKTIVVEMDEKESGLRAVLNYGHTFGHAYEAANGYRHLLHGEALAAGMVAAARMSHRMNLCAKDVVEAQTSLIQRAGLPLQLKNLSLDAIRKHMQVDKKALGGKLRFVLAESIGKVVIRNDVPPELVDEAVKESLLNV